MARPKNDGRGRIAGGRKKGTPNKMSREMRELISAFIDGRWDEFMEAYSQITDPEKKCRIFLDLLPYATPKLASVEYKDKTPVKTFKDELDEISGEKTRG